MPAQVHIQPYANDPGLMVYAVRGESADETQSAIAEIMETISVGEFSLPTLDRKTGLWVALGFASSMPEVAS